MTDQALQQARALVERLFRAGLAAVDPVEAVRAALRVEDANLVVNGARTPLGKGVHVVGVGKAAVAMTRGALEILGDGIVSGDIVTKDGHNDGSLPDRIRVFEAGHPVPDQRGVDATRAIIEALHRLGGDTIVLALISGGGSALLEAPSPGVSLADFAKTTDLLLRAGAPIEALNAVRTPISQVKGGGLRDAAPLSSWVTLILSDVLGNDVRVIASGPTIPAPRNGSKALQIIDRYGVRSSVPTSVLRALDRVTPQDSTMNKMQDIVGIVGDNAAAVMAALEEGRSMGLRGSVVWEAAEGEAADLGRAFVAGLCDAPNSLDFLLGGGEATVTVRGDGSGGRNTEFALSAGIELQARALHDWVVASLATDGQDALTGLAGAMADADMVNRAQARHVEVLEALRRNDSCAVFEAAGGQVQTGPTGTNVNDLYIAARIRRSNDAGKGNGGD